MLAQQSIVSSQPLIVGSAQVHPSVFYPMRSRFGPLHSVLVRLQYLVNFHKAVSLICKLLSSSQVVK